MNSCHSLPTSLTWPEHGCCWPLCEWIHIWCRPSSPVVSAKISVGFAHVIPHFFIMYLHCWSVDSCCASVLLLAPAENETDANMFCLAPLTHINKNLLQQHSTHFFLKKTVHWDDTSISHIYEFQNMWAKTDQSENITNYHQNGKGQLFSLFQ